MSVTIYIPRDSGALALGADKVAKAIEAEIASARRSTSRSSATARAAPISWSRWSRWRPLRAGSLTAR